ncbi:MAG: hypothetical protein CMJ72_06215, partial [Planctomycetaceae bacterium]|nr:hypothetical protein [Planctomycetaceae bacterium]
MGSRLTAAGSAGFDVSGALNVNSGAVFDNTFGYLGYESDSTGVATVSGNGSRWDNSRFLFVGYQGDGTLNVLGGGVVSNELGSIGDWASSTGVVTVSGSGSQWNNSLGLGVGSAGSGTLNVLEGGLVSNGGNCTIGYSGTGVATVSGIGSQWINSSWLTVGGDNDGTLEVLDGGVVSNSEGFIGKFSGSTSVATVRGSGSQWNNSSDLSVGTLGSGTLNVEAGGVVNNTTGFIGHINGSTGLVTVTGSGSQWNHSVDLAIGGGMGAAGGTGLLTIADGGLVDVSGTTKLWSTGTLTLDGGSLITGTFEKTAGEIFMFNKGTLGVTDSGQILTIDANNFSLANGTTFNTNAGTTTLVTEQHLEINGLATIDGGGILTTAGGSLAMEDILFVGNSSDGTLNVLAGGVVSNSEGFIGSSNGSTGVATVSGSGSQWNNSSHFYVGHQGDGTLNVEAGGVVSNSSGSIGTSNGSTGVATVSGSGSQWNNSGTLSVGTLGSGTLSVLEGGLVSNTVGRLAYESDSTGVVTVSGSGSQWNNTENLYVGIGGSGTLNVEAGGVVSNTIGYIGNQSNNSSSVATVSGVGSQWSNSERLYIGGSASGGTGALTITDSGLVDVLGKTQLFNYQGTLTLDGGSLTTGTLDNNHGGTFTFNDGVLTVNGVSGHFSPGTNFFTLDGNTLNANPTLVLTAGATGTFGDSFTVGSTNQATLNVSAGSLLSNTFGYLGYESDSTGVATVSGNGSRWDNSRF